jgi:hypothetical protein
MSEDAQPHAVDEGSEDIAIIGGDLEESDLAEIGS